ncbi:hypothetical protein TNCT_640811 [Trichonephila clavata]|uniref:Uncharacterized protein n=1 Tax=Trichonephila clavata TaxID=2740835 RepID=A0A8X6M3R6_TRICU|nr:hypothetical protein TNCT_640811 [Trichonephila clavata]
MVYYKKVDERTRAEKRGFCVSRKSSAPYSRSDFRIGKKCSGVLRIEASTKGDKKSISTPTVKLSHSPQTQLQLKEGNLGTGVSFESGRGVWK